MKQLSLIVLISISLTGCGSDNDTVTLRKFPHPYKAALAICSDIDGTDSIEKFMAIQKFLNTTEEGAFGRGLELEVGNTFWFYNQQYELHKRRLAGESVPDVFFSGEVDFGISIFDGTSDTLTAYAPTILALIRSGYLDCLHTYGNFGVDGFTRDLATQAVEFLANESLTVDVWVNHGGKENEHKIGDVHCYGGDNPETKVYHTDLTIPTGIKFLWRGHRTHIIGQDGNFTFKNLTKRTYEYVQDLFYTEQSFPHDNELVHVYELDDGQKVFEFVRFINPWGKYSIPREPFIVHQLGPAQVDELIENQGYLIFYTHLGVNPQPPIMHDSTIDALRYIKKRFDDGNLFVTTTSKLLNYYVHHKYLFWRTEQRSDSLFIIIDSIANDVEGGYIPEANDLEGFTFYIPENCEDCIVTVTADDRTVPSVFNGRDDTGMLSVSIPWQRLTFPRIDLPYSREAHIR